MNPFLRAPYQVAGQLANLVAGFVPSGGGKVRRSFAARAGVIERAQAWARDERSPSAPLVWIHAASVGEGLMAKPVIDRIRYERPDAQIAYTFFSPSAQEFAKSLRVDFADYLPFDTADAADAMLTALTPAIVMFSKLDVWPLLVAAAARRHVRLVLTSAALSESSGRRSALAKLLLSDAYGLLDAVGAVHDDDAKRLVEIGVRPDRITITGDVRYDQVWERVNAPSPNAALLAVLESVRPTLVAGSTWPGDDACLCDGWAQLSTLASVPKLRMIIAPHEPTADALAALEARAAGIGKTCERLSAATANTDLVLVDRMGVLADLYALADVAYVGGGFHDDGLHSVVEPAAYGAPVLFGPRFDESRDAVALVAAGGGFSVGSGVALATRLASLVNDPATQTRASDSAGETAGQCARRVIVDGLGAADRSAALVVPLLRPLRPSR